MINHWLETETVLAGTTREDFAFATYADVVMKQWHSGAQVIIGDAAHGMSPQLGQGTNLALLDAVVLADCVNRSSDITAASPFTFSIRADGRSETWQRNFPGHEMRSVLVVESGRLVERLGVFRLRFLLQAGSDGLSMRLERITGFGIPCPRWLFPRVIARETSKGSDFLFHIELHMPLAGRVVRYRGSLDMNSVRDAR